ncbi:HD domain-containing protein [Limnohabitans sp.]|uniref:HD domain-containing protein n=1 Tax=Limnohabitans sp. TaxID=1907725 RepID=UPI0039BD62AE|nr:phosphohydrolase [Comamonadaceae bacterium]
MHFSTAHILGLYQQAAHRIHSGERVTHLAHAWQCGRLAEKSGASLKLQLASWLHDIGHLWAQQSALTTDPAVKGHAALGSRLLEPLFGLGVSEPVRLHVLAKRYLVTTRDSYVRKLSPQSLRSLTHQGGVLNEGECSDFERQAFFAEAIQLRIWDDLGQKDGWFEISIQDALDQLDGLMQSVAAQCVT